MPLAVTRPAPTIARTMCDGCRALELRVRDLELRLSRGRRLASEPEDALLVMTLAAALGGTAFTARDLHAVARTHDDLQRALGRVTVRQIGKRLHALTGRVLGGFIVRRIKRDGDGVLWLVSVAHLHTGSIVGDRDGAD